MYQLVLKRFAKAFVSGGVASLLLALSQAPTSLEHLKAWLLALGVAFLTGGLMAIEKTLQTPTV